MRIKFQEVSFQLFVIAQGISVRRRVANVARDRKAILRAEMAASPPSTQTRTCQQLGVGPVPNPSHTISCTILIFASFSRCVGEDQVGNMFELPVAVSQQLATSAACTNPTLRLPWNFPVRRGALPYYALECHLWPERRVHLQLSFEVNVWA
ncbi:hypothetical protein BD410DRAFT_829098 [Rickenella mellea]|uniref:Uncharacterized protein n=1 Tax=Rickenella mellea TaxID=50990 RepID=A0A4Y7Q108_9AGAM|nr:hypothetical protein BD410DRAFT_829098 [Rickenella mellea]